MTGKFGRKYELTILPAQYQNTDTAGNISFSSPDVLSGFAGGALKGFASVFGAIDPNVIRITNPFTMEFSITKMHMSKTNYGTFRIYNLGHTTRNQLFKDDFNELGLRRVTFKAGYEEPLPIVFDGNIQRCTSSRAQGNTNFITEIVATDGFLVPNNHSTRSWPGQVKKQEVVDQVIKNLSQFGLSRGIVHQYDDVYYNRVISGFSWNILEDETQGACFIDNREIHVLGEDECYTGSAANVIDSSSGLLGAPTRADRVVTAEMVFEPTFRVGQLAVLNSTSQKIFNGNYKVTGLHHYGIISDAVSGKCQTNVTLYNSKIDLKIVNRINSLV